MGAMAKKTMPALFKQLDKGLAAGPAQNALEALTALARVAAGPFVGALFKTLLQRLLEATLAADQDHARAVRGRKWGKPPTHTNRQHAIHSRSCYFLCRPPI